MCGRELVIKCSTRPGTGVMGAAGRAGVQPLKVRSSPASRSWCLPKAPGWAARAATAPDMSPLYHFRLATVAGSRGVPAAAGRNLSAHSGCPAAKATSAASRALLPDRPEACAVSKRRFRPLVSPEMKAAMSTGGATDRGRARHSALATGWTTRPGRRRDSCRASTTGSSEMCLAAVDAARAAFFSKLTKHHSFRGPGQ